MFLGRILLTLGCQRLQRTNDAETRVARLDNIVDIAVAGSVVGIREFVVVLFLFLGYECCFLLGFYFKDGEKRLYRTKWRW